VIQSNRNIISEYLKRYKVLNMTVYRIVKDNGARQIGVSNYGPKTLRSAASVVAAGGGKICTNQVRLRCTALRKV
jgi:diketogulonate reductase-like aldo/keto reductase